MPLAASELKYTDANILGVAVKYGYETASGFSRAFKAWHGVTPREVQTGEKEPKVFERLFFVSPQYAGNKTYRFEGGALKMAKLTEIQFKKFDSYKVIGRAIHTKLMSNDISMAWGKFFSDGSCDALIELCKGKSNQTPLPSAYTGVMYDFKDDNKITYLIGIIFSHSTVVPDGFDCFEIPECMIAEAQITGEEYEIYSQGHELVVSAVAEAGYEIDWNHFFQCEVYTDKRFSEPKNSGERLLTLDYYLPVKLK